MCVNVARKWKKEFIKYFIGLIFIPCISDVLEEKTNNNSGGSNKLPDDGRLLPKHVGANT
jgi:hypothetical protein